MGYEIWDRDAALLLEDFDEEGQALAYLRNLLAGLTPEEATRTVDRLQLVLVSDGGSDTRIVAEGVALLQRAYVSVSAGSSPA